MIKNYKGWAIFLDDCTKNILPIYEEHEKKFDMYGIHGRQHIARCIIFSEFIARHYEKIGKNINFLSIRYATAFHDSGRQANGIDLWEEDSSKNCYLYLSKIFPLESEYASSLILKVKKNQDINRNIVQGADTLDIMRPVCGHGERDGFIPEYFNFLDDNIKMQLVDDAWKFIEYTEDNSHYLRSNNILYKMINILDRNNFGLLSDF